MKFVDDDDDDDDDDDGQESVQNYRRGSSTLDMYTMLIETDLLKL